MRYFLIFLTLTACGQSPTQAVQNTVYDVPHEVTCELLDEGSHYRVFCILNPTGHL